MTWTVFEHQFGDNETVEDAPGRGGYKYVFVPMPAPQAVEWWRDEYDEDPKREVMPDPHDDAAWMEEAWTLSQYQDDEEARTACGEMELDQGGIGSPMRRAYTWSELRGRLDVRIVADDEEGEE
jgi:hypothetical protein